MSSDDQHGTGAADVEYKIQEYEGVKQRCAELENTMKEFCTSASWVTEMREWVGQSLEKIQVMREECQESLEKMEKAVAVPQGTYWSTKMLSRHCSLMLDEKRLIRKDGNVLPKNNPSWADVIKLTSTLTNLKTKGFVTKKQAVFIEAVEEHLKGVFFEGKELRRITEALATKLSEEIEQQTITADLTKHEHVISDLVPDLENCENLLEAALLNGDMALAEEISYNQIALHERLLRIVQEQYPIIRKRQEDSREFKRRRRWAIFRMANRDVASVVELKYRQIEACEDDIQKIKTQVANYSQDDLGQRRRYDLDKAESDKFLSENAAHQDSLWKKVSDLCTELQSTQKELADLVEQRKKELNRRSVLREKEEGRRSGHLAFLNVAEVYLGNLNATIENSEKAKDICKAINDFILDGCDSVALKFDRTESVLAEMATRVNRQYLKQFTDYYLAVGRLHHRKHKKRALLEASISEHHVRLELALDSIDPLAKKHAEAKASALEQRKSLDHEMEALHTKMVSSSKAFEEVADSLRSLNIPFVHPEVILQKSCDDRNEKILDYRDLVNTTEAKQEQLLEEEATQLSKEKEAHTIKVRAAQSQKAAAKGLHPIPPMGAGSNRALAKYHAASFSRYKNLCDTVLTQDEVEAAEVEQQAAASTEAATMVTAPPHPTHKPNLPERIEGRVVMAVYPFRATSSDELTFNKGERIVVINEGTEDGWHYGICNQRTGLYPSNYVTLAPEELEY